MSKEDELRDALNNTANEISQLSKNPRTWLAWITYLLERLEEGATDFNPTYQQSYREMLEALQDVIRNRLKTGGW